MRMEPLTTRRASRGLLKWPSHMLKQVGDTGTAGYVCVGRSCSMVNVHSCLVKPQSVKAPIHTLNIDVTLFINYTSNNVKIIFTIL